MIIDFEGKILKINVSLNLSLGNIDGDTIFTFDTDTEVWQSCAATLHDEFWVIGGLNKKRQVIIWKVKMILENFSGDFYYIIVDQI